MDQRVYRGHDSAVLYSRARARVLPAVTSRRTECARPVIGTAVTRRASCGRVE